VNVRFGQTNPTNQECTMGSTVDRRKFLKMTSAAAAGTAVAPLGLLYARSAEAKKKARNVSGACDTASFSVPGFGPIKPKLPLNTAELGDIAGAGDLRNVPLISLPDPFVYTAISIRGDIMSDGVPVPGDHDGMACFQGQRGNYVLVRNHELSPDEEEAGDTTGCLPPNGKVYDPFTGDAEGLGGGGTTNVVVDRQGRLVEDFVSLGGTYRNCAGGATPWGSWISCEENVSTPATSNLVTLKHGYNFEVPSSLSEAVDPIPLKAMGRMNHEAITVDPRSGYVYQTEDRRDSAYYKYVPKKRPNGFGDLQEDDGDLYAMVIVPNQTSDCTGEYLPLSAFNDGSQVDTRGTDRGAAGSMLPFLGQHLKVKWVKLENVDPDEDTLRFEAQNKGAAVFWRGEGAWYDKGIHYWVCSGAGDIGEGQVWAYDPKTETVTMILESTNEDLLDGPDNMTIARDGTIYLCEDGSSGSPGEPRFSERVVGVDSNGGLFDFSRNELDTSEFCGACFSPNGKYMYVNSQGVGITYCIWREDNRPIYLNTGFARRR
jgi:secreted PhoX family phosphatase